MHLQWITSQQCTTLVIGFVKIYKLNYPIVLLCLIIKYYADLLIWMDENNQIQIPTQLFLKQIIYNNKIAMPFTFIFGKDSLQLILLKLIFEQKKLDNQQEPLLCINLCYQHYDSKTKQMVYFDGWHRVIITFNKLTIKAINNSSVTFPSLSTILKFIKKKTIVINFSIKCEFFPYNSLA